MHIKKKSCFFYFRVIYTYFYSMNSHERVQKAYSDSEEGKGLLSCCLRRSNKVVIFQIKVCYCNTQCLFCLFLHICKHIFECSILGYQCFYIFILKLQMSIMAN